MYHCTTFGTLDGSKGSSKAGAANVDEDHAKALRRLNDMKKVNIVITIDGTKSMGQYFDAVKDALNEIDKYFDTKVNVGVMVYRDKEDGDKVTECFPSVGFTQPNNPNLHKWIDDIIKNRLNSKAKDLRESLFYGINKAIDQFFPEGKGLENQSNIMLVIGDCGDNGKFEISRKTLVDKIAARNITMMGFQVVNKSKDDYTIFNQQMKYLMRYSIQKRYAQASKLPLDINPKERDGGKVVEMAIADPKFKDNFFIGLHCSNPDKDKPMQKEYLTASIEKVLGEWKASVDYLNRIVGNYSDYGEQETLAEEDIEGTQLRNDVIRYMLGDDALFERLKEQRELLSFRGWAKKQQDRRDLFKVIVFFPARELEGLLRTLQNVYMVAKKEADNKQSKPDCRPYYEAMMKLARTVMAQKDISSTSYNKILAKVFGLVDYQDSYSLEDIIDPNIVSDNQFRDIVNKMYDKVRQLQNVTAGDYPFLLTYSGNNDMYYWLPSEYLPLI